MTEERRSTALKLRLAEWWWEPSSKVIVAFVVAGFIAAALFALGPTRTKRDFWNSHGLGIGWECTSGGRGAYVCLKDVPPALQNPNSNKGGATSH